MSLFDAARRNFAANPGGVATSLESGLFFAAVRILAENLTYRNVARDAFLNFIPMTPLSTLLQTFTLFDLAETAAGAEAGEWREEAGLNLFLEDSIALLRDELVEMPGVIARRDEKSTPENGRTFRPRVWVMCGQLSEAAREIEHYTRVAEHADVWLFGIQDAQIAEIPGLQTIGLTPGSPLSQERTVIVDGPTFGAALFASEAGQLDEEDAASLYCEGFLSARPSVVSAAAERLCRLLDLPPTPSRQIDSDLTITWQSRLGTRLLEHLEGQKLALRARTSEMKTLNEENKRKENLLRGYVGGATWQAIEQTLQEGRSIVNERRQELTICFCDLVGFTSLSERLHPSEVASFLNDHFAKLHDIVRAHGGWVDKFIGDAMLAVFENPTEAMSAAQKMVQDARTVRVNQNMEQAIQLRVGLNTGIVALASLGVPEKREITVLGDAVNLAQRLQSSAPPHSVMLSSRTFARLPFPISRVMEPLELTVKGKRDPVQCYLWTPNAERRKPDERIVLRESILTAARRTSLGDRLRAQRPTPDAPSEAA